MFPFFAGVREKLVIVYSGQSDMGTVMESVSGTPEAAAPNTYWWNPSSSAWETPPAVVGLRKMLNDLAALTGQSVGAVGHAIAAADLATLTTGAEWDALEAKIAASGGRADALVFYQGHGNISGKTNSSPLDQASTERTWLDAVATLHGKVALASAKTTASMPIVMCSLQRSNNNIGTISTWNQVNRAIASCGEVLTNAWYSHSNTDLALSDEVAAGGYDDHVTAAECSKVGARFARTIARSLGYVSQSTELKIVSAAVASGTTTTVTIQHGAGTDFTPTSGITGFEVSEDNGTTWISATGARASTTTITLTHSSIGNDRLVRYQWAWVPDITGIVKDNSSLAVPLPRSRDEIVCSGRTSTYPWPQWIGRVWGANSVSDTVTTHKFMTRTVGANRRIHGFVNIFENRTISSVLIKNGLTGDTLATATLVDQRNAQAFTSCAFQADVTTVDILDVVVTYSGAVTIAQVGMWEVDSSLISGSPTFGYGRDPVSGTGSGKTVAAASLAVSVHGAVMSLGNNWNVDPTSATTTYENGTVAEFGGEKALLYGSETTYGASYDLTADATFTATHTISDAELVVAVHAMAVAPP